MTDEELLIWLRVEDTNLTDFAADRIEALVKARREDALELLAAHGQAQDAYEAQLKAEARAERLEEALLWCSGSADFNEGGVAREGWLKVCAPLLKGESHD